jgi:hypothetical protein
MATFAGFDTEESSSGPFVEAKEVVGGFRIIRAGSA